MNEVNVFYKTLQRYVNFVIEKRCNERFSGYKNAYEIIWPEILSFTYKVKIEYFDGIPVQSLDYSKIKIVVPVKSNFSTLPKLSDIEIFVDSDLFEEYIYKSSPKSNTKFSYKNTYIKFLK